MGRVLSLCNRQRTRRVNVRRFRQVARTLLHDLLRLEQFDLGACLVAAPEMTRLNETFLHHAGSTDVIAFDHRDATFVVASSGDRTAGTRRKADLPVAGELVLCVDEAVIQARRFRTTWQAELVRYLIHGLLHLLGHDDREPSRRRAMKREEDRLLRELARRFVLRQLERKPSPKTADRRRT